MQQRLLPTEVASLEPWRVTPATPPTPTERATMSEIANLSHHEATELADDLLRTEPSVPYGSPRMFYATFVARSGDTWTVSYEKRARFVWND